MMPLSQYSVEVISAWTGSEQSSPIIHFASNAPWRYSAIDVSLTKTKKQQYNRMTENTVISKHQPHCRTIIDRS
jgi:hypothetical protein